MTHCRTCWLLLPVDSAHSLGVVAGVPGGVEDDDTIGSNQIHPQTASSGGHQEELDFGVGVEVVDQFLSVQGAGAAVQSVVIDSGDPGILGLSQLLPLQEILDEIQCEQGLGEEQNSIISLH